MVGAYSTSKQSHMKVGSNNRRLGVRLIETLINVTSFELGLKVGAKRAFLNVTSPNDFRAYSLDKSANFVHTDISETFLILIGHF